MIRILLFLLVSFSLCFGQTGSTLIPEQIQNGYVYTASGCQAVTSQSFALTLQVAGTTTRKIYPMRLVIEPDFASSATFEMYGNVGTTTTVSALGTNTQAVPQAILLKMSNAGSGTLISPISGWDLGVNEKNRFNLTDIMLNNGSAVQRTFTVRVSSGTGNVCYFIKWKEK